MQLEIPAEANTRASTIARLLRERARQEKKWGPVEGKTHTLEKWLVILMEEVGEAAEDIQEGRDPSEELIQVAAVASLAAVDNLSFRAVELADRFG